MAYGSLAVDKITNSDGFTLGGSGASMKNRIINGAMMIDQRATSVTADAFTVDRWKYSADAASKATVAQDSTAPNGFVNSLKVTSSSDYSVPAGETFKLQQRIEGLNVSDLAWGTANAKTITISFYVRSSLTGTFGGALRNSGATRSYPFTYTISGANTWEQKSITVAGDTTGTWLTTSGIGIEINFGLGVGSTYSGTAGAWAATNYISATGATSVVGTNGATFYITGVQLEVGSTATSFDYRPYGTELALCQRYYYKIKAADGNEIFGSGYNASTTAARGLTFFPVTLRTIPTALEQSGTASDYRVLYTGNNTNCNSVPVISLVSTYDAMTEFPVASGLTAGQGIMLRSNSLSAYLAWSAEL